MEVPCPALVAADLRVVVCCVPCPVTCAPCWAALWPGSRTPSAARRAARRDRIARRPTGSRTLPRRLPAPSCCCCPSSRLSVQQIDLPVRALHADIEFAQIAGDLVGLRAQLGHRERGEHLQLRPKLPPDPAAVAAA